MSFVVYLYGHMLLKTTYSPPAVFVVNLLTTFDKEPSPVFVICHSIIFHAPHSND